MTSLLKTINGFQLFHKCLKQSINISVPKREKYIPKPRYRHPEWLPKPQRVLYDEQLTKDNKQFLDEVVQDKYDLSTVGFGTKFSPLKIDLIEPTVQWKQGMKRTGLIAKKIGAYPLWLKNGKKVSSTLLQVVDNEIVKYIPPEKFFPVKSKKPAIQIKNRCGCLVVGAENIDPQLVTKEYYNIFNDAGVTPKRILRRFIVSPEAALQPGTPLFATHFKPGEIVDIRGKTIDQGFQGVMKRWGFKGMPASHGVTKTHRRPGNIGSGGQKSRVMPGTKMPGHMGNRWRIIRGVQILRINTKYNVIWVLGHNIPGEINTYCYIYDTLLPRRQPTTAPNFPTYLPSITEESLPEELYADNVHSFADPTIEFKEEP
ncbi:PREDICTED: 39S ribosomal protein L3, mitochondrial [Trachymyrmex septentrionalis]|uniref:39S ribosomal protein L3, mitochondrial n=1 Tax=Trachymyrmex septentrionalis TaxID=34720 RepID=UPI00084F4720|nr:PREDICTED: 39S ribosomal protein L3, mitochondrial [Trachymyrmex septentrionalis]